MKLIHVGCACIVATMATGCPPKSLQKNAQVIPLDCSPMLQIAGRDIKFTGIEIPGAKNVYKLGEFAYKDVALQTAQHALMQFDFSRMSTCRLAVSYAQGTERRTKLEDRMEEYAAAALDAAAKMERASNPKEGAKAIQEAEKAKATVAAGTSGA